MRHAPFVLSLILHSPALAQEAQKAPPKAAPEPAEAPSAPEEAPTAASLVHVVAVEDGHAWLAVEGERRYEPGELVSLQSRDTIEVAGRAYERGTERALGKVRSSDFDMVEVELGVNHEAAVGQTAVDVRARSGRRLLAPRRAHGYVAAAVSARGFVSLSEDGGGVVGDARVAWVAKPWFRLDVRLAPVQGIGDAGTGRGFGVVSGTVVASFDHDLFALGIGGGVGNTRRLGGGAVGLFAQHVRIGATDGLHLWVDNQFVREGGTWFLDDLDTRLVVPMTAGRLPSWFVVHAQGGAYDYGTQHVTSDLGARFRVRGDGQAGTIQVTPAIGIVYAETYRPTPPDPLDPWAQTTDSQQYIGPAFGLDLEARF